jgi:uncharacterized protein (DUF4415 family)
MTKHRRLTAAEEAAIQKRIAADPDAPEASDEELAQARPFADVFPALAESIKRSRGRPRIAAPKQAVSLRIDPATLAKFQNSTHEWRQVMTAALDAADAAFIERLKHERGIPVVADISRLGKIETRERGARIVQGPREARARKNPPR